MLLRPVSNRQRRVSLPALVPQDVLLVEDNLIIALDTEEVMQRLGVATVRVASGVADALKTIDERKPDFALLDVNLGVETSLRNRGAVDGAESAVCVCHRLR